MVASTTRTGRPRRASLAFLRDGDDLVVVASKGGAPHHPGWYHNLKANPAVRVEIGAGTSSATAVEITGDERDSVYSRQAAAIENFAAYQAGTDRTIPVIELIVE